ncbi:hypothetical protein BDW59DRAFT_163838 [Aspergillus cavernicola]|uniref:Uncharacterized protein n=1 Tax=Aspergillus cavernicola TaxID=176166 RepID=A0ABR4I3D5_9EURO
MPLLIEMDQFVAHARDDTPMQIPVSEWIMGAVLPGAHFARAIMLTSVDVARESMEWMKGIPFKDTNFRVLVNGSSYCRSNSAISRVLAPLSDRICRIGWAMSTCSSTPESTPAIGRLVTPKTRELEILFLSNEPLVDKSNEKATDGGNEQPEYPRLPTTAVQKVCLHAFRINPTIRDISEPADGARTNC